MMIGVFPVLDGIANQKMKKRIVCRRNRSSHICLVGSCLAKEEFGLRYQLFRQIVNHRPIQSTKLR